MLRSAMRRPGSGHHPGAGSAACRGFGRPTDLEACTVVSGRDAMARGQRSRRASKLLPWRATSDRKKKDPSTEAKKMPRWTWRTCPSPTWTLVALRRVISRACEYRRISRSATTPSTCTKPTSSTRPIPTLNVASPHAVAKLWRVSRPSRPTPSHVHQRSELLRRSGVPTTTYCYNDLLRLRPTATDYHDLCL